MKKFEILNNGVLASKTLAGAGQRHEYRKGSDSTHGENIYLKYYDRAGIEAANAKNIYQQFASKREMPTKYGKEYVVPRWFRDYDRDVTSAEFAKYGFLSSRSLEDVSNGIAKLELSEGADSSTNLVNLRKINLKTNLNRYGAKLDYTDEADIFSNDDVQVRYREELGEHANLTYEDLLQKDMLATNNVLYAGAGTSLATMGVGLTADATLDKNYMISFDYIRACEQKLRRNRAAKVTELVTGSNKIDTRTCAAAYYAIIGPEIAWDLRNLTRGESYEKEFVYIPVEQYASASSIAEGEIGQMSETRFILSETALVYRGKGQDVPAGYVGDLAYTGEIGNGAKFDVFPILYPTKDSFATVGLKGHNKVVFHSRSPMDIEQGNPFGTKGFFTYNFWYSSIILQEEKLLKGLVLASDR
jgi:N4-gp56 family major capsid protein